MKKSLFLTVLASGGGKTYNQQIIDTAPIAYWPFNELSGAAAINYGTLGAAANGAYTGATLAQIAAPGGGLAPLFDGVNDFCDLYSAAFAGAFNPALGSMAVWFRTVAGLSSGVILSIRTDDTNRVIIKHVADTTGDFNLEYNAGGTAETSSTYDATTGAWYHAVVTWSVAADQVIFYVNGAQLGVTATGLGTWVGALNAARCTAGCYSTSATLDYNGYIAHPALWDKVLTPTEILTMYNGGLG